MSENLKFDRAYWDDLFEHTAQPTSEADKLHLVFSLIIYLGLALSKLLTFAFTSKIRVVRERAGTFLSIWKGAGQSEWYGPSELYNIWHDEWPRTRGELHERIVKPCAHKIALDESNRVIQENSFRVRLKELTIADVRRLLDPAAVADRLRTLAPFTISYLHVFTASPNRYRKDLARKAEALERRAGETSDGEEDVPPVGSEPVEGAGGGGHSEGIASDPFADTGPAPEDWRAQYLGFTRNPMIAIITAIMMLAFVRNRATNVLALPLGLFFGISGTSSRVLNMLSNIGLSVSITTIEDMKVQMSKDAIRLAIAVLTSSAIFYIIFDNINLYLRKFQERITNRHSMIHATNAAVVLLPGLDEEALNLKAKLALRGQRAKARLSDIRPTHADDEHMEKAFITDGHTTGLGAATTGRPAWTSGVRERVIGSRGRARARRGRGRDEGEGAGRVDVLRDAYDDRGHTYKADKRSGAIGRTGGRTGGRASRTASERVSRRADEEATAHAHRERAGRMPSTQTQPTDVRAGGKMGARAGERMDEREGGRTSGRADEQAGGWADGRTSRQGGE
ncbi:uncharacterized protein B0H18DRAFT_1127083 [Fomitopsis serialis]|uniref:uncharacterized protein n=1 Tax=Fomitopsis serialis TaxID=139415 RepID=UPI00200839AA|nr:uncharacterized protein B0H18DRAFT_1127083 [Neoantrodia serialis]KAH9912508.1 hypothetical protein B0H18DRAFT_1127083 [Neoantrodia serialis]